MKLHIIWILLSQIWIKFFVYRSYLAFRNKDEVQIFYVRHSLHIGGITAISWDESKPSLWYRQQILPGQAPPARQEGGPADRVRGEAPHHGVRLAEESSTFWVLHEAEERGLGVVLFFLTVLLSAGSTSTTSAWSKWSRSGWTGWWTSSSGLARLPTTWCWRCTTRATSSSRTGSTKF